MSQFTWTLVVLIAAAAIYWFVVRPRLKARPELAAYYREIEAYELRLWSRIVARLRGLKTYIMLFGAVALESYPDIVRQMDLSMWVPQEWVGRVTQMLTLGAILTHAASQARAVKREE